MQPLATLILDACGRWPERAAVIGAEEGEGSSISYAALAIASDILGKRLRDLRVTADEPVIVFVSNVVTDIVALLAVWRIGAVAVPVHRGAGTVTLKQTLARTGARFLVLGDQPLGRDDLQISPDDQSRGVLTLDVPQPASASILRDAALVIFTSGSTGEPKGVVLSHVAFAGKLKAIDQVLKFPDAVRTLLPLQLNFSFGEWVSLITLAHGGTLILQPKFSPAGFIHALTRHRIERTAVVPTMMRALLPLIEEGGTHHDVMVANTSFELLIAGGEPLSAVLGSRFRTILPKMSITDVFGLTETCTSDFILRPDLFDANIGSIGFASPGVAYRIVDPNTGAEVALGETGELEIQSPFQMNGYLHDERRTRDSYRGEFLMTGDLARTSASGAIQLIGRAKDIIVRGGNKISPVEIDRVVVQHPDVYASLTTGVPDSLMGERIHTLVVFRELAATSPEDLRGWLASRLDRFKIPDRIHVGQTLPMGNTGKDDRKALRRLIEEGQL